jgi:hypothetical protein
MRVLFLLIFAFILPSILYGQDSDIPELKTWEDINSKLYVSKVIEFVSTPFFRQSKL